MTVRLYKGADDDFRRNDDKIPSGNYELIYNSDKTKARISYVNRQEDLIEQMLVTEFQDEGGTPYADAAALETALAGFFKPSGNGGVINVSENTVAQGDGVGGVLNSLITYNPTLARYECAIDFFAPALLSESGSLILGDSKLASAGRGITTKSESTGNRATFWLQLFDDNGYKKGTVFDHTQPSVLVQIQNSDDSIATGFRINNFTQVVQTDVQFMRIRFKPEGGTITAPFTFSYKIGNATVAAYNETIEVGSSDLTDLGGGIWELKLDNPTIFDAGNEVHITTEGLSLLGGNGFTGPILIGDPSISDFFPWLTAQSILIVRKDVATEDFVTDYTKAYTQAEKDKLAGLTGGRYLGVFADLAALEAAHPTATVGDTATVTDPNSNQFYWKVPPGGWADTGTGAGGDMFKAIYDPSAIGGDAFSMGNMVETANEKVLTNSERSKLNDIEEDAQKNVQSDWNQANALEDDFVKNKPAIIPEAPIDGNKYARKNGAWEIVTEGVTVNKMTIEPTSNIENLDVSSLSPLGILFVNNTSNRELRSLSGGSDGDIIHLTHLTLNDLKIKNPDSYPGQQIATPGDADRTLMDYGGCTLIYSSTLGCWVATGLYY